MSPRRIIRDLVDAILAELSTGDTAPPEEQALRVARIVLRRYGLSRRLTAAIVDEVVSVLARTATPAQAANAARAASTLAPQIGRLSGGIDANIVRAIRRSYRRGELATFDGLREQLQRTRRLSVAQADAVAQTATAAFDRASTMAGDSPATRYRYAGPGAERAFCQAMLSRSAAGESWTIAEIRAMSNGTGLPVEFTCGGWRCRHRWLVAVDYQSGTASGAATGSA